MTNPMSSPVTPVGEAPAAVQASTAAAPPQGIPDRPGRLLRSVGVGITLVVLAVVLAIVVVYLISGLGAASFTVALVLALVPLAIVLLGVRWVDRWEPEPRSALLFAFLWGAGLSVLVALVVGAQVQNVVAALGGPGPGYDFFASVIQAPLVEETGKGLGLLLLVVAARRHFDGPVDGVVYAATIAGGFAFSENILYFGSAIADPSSSGGVVETFLIRGLLSPFAHVMFTAVTGLALGVAAARGTRWALVPALLAGLAGAALLHAFWNGSLYFVSDFYGYYALVQVPLFLVAVALVAALRRREAALTQARLAEYAAAGWFHPDEVVALGTPGGRRMTRAWAARNGVGPAMSRYIRDSTRLALTRQRILSGSGRAKALADEPRLLERVVESRRLLTR